MPGTALLDPALRRSGCSLLLQRAETDHGPSVACASACDRSDIRPRPRQLSRSARRGAKRWFRSRKDRDPSKSPGRPGILEDGAMRGQAHRPRRQPVGERQLQDEDAVAASASLRKCAVDEKDGSRCYGQRFTAPFGTFAE